MLDVPSSAPQLASPSSFGKNLDSWSVRYTNKTALFGLLYLLGQLRIRQGFYNSLISTYPGKFWELVSPNAD